MPVKYLTQDNGDPVAVSIADHDAQNRPIDQEIDHLYSLIGGDEVKTYGVRFYGSDPTGVRMYDAVGLQANVGYEGESPLNNFDKLPIFKDIKRVKFEARDSTGAILRDTGGNIIYNYMVTIPNFYFSFTKGTDGTGSYDEFKISNAEQTGMTHIFGDNRRYALVGSYFTNAIPNSALYGSVSGVEPRVNVSQYGINSSMSYIRVDGSDVQLNSSESKLVWDAIAYLMMIEFATRNLQTPLPGINSESWTNPITDATVGTYNAGKTGTTIVVSTSKSEAKADRVAIYGLSGVSTNSWKELTVVSKSVNTPSSGLTTLTVSESITFPSSGTVYICASTGTKTGKTDKLICPSGFEGLRTDSLSTSLRHMRYRGIEDPYGNLWNILSDYAYRITYSSGNYTRETLKRPDNGDKTSPNNWTVVADTNWANADGYVKTINVKENTIVVEEIGASSVTYYCDYHYRDAPTAATSYRCFLAGGYGSVGASDGPLYFYCDYGFALSSYYCALRPFIYVV